MVGGTLLLTVVGTLFFMAIFSIEMERISLGALIIAMGMLVDNAIVVAEGMQIAMRRGKSSRDACEDVASRTQIPLLGATLIGIMAFAGIGLSPDSTGEFMFSLFAVIGISLLLSWVLAITATPLLGHYLFRVGSGGADDDPYGGLMFRLYGGFLRSALRLRWLVTCWWWARVRSNSANKDSLRPLSPTITIGFRLCPRPRRYFFCASLGCMGAKCSSAFDRLPETVIARSR